MKSILGVFLIAAMIVPSMVFAETTIKHFPYNTTGFTVTSAAGTTLNGSLGRSFPRHASGLVPPPDRDKRSIREDTPETVSKEVARVYSLEPNYPNPFNPSTSIQFTVKQSTHVNLRIYGADGRLVRTLADEERAAGVAHVVVWDGRNEVGHSVASGVYFYKLSTKEFSQTKKMVLLK